MDESKRQAVRFLEKEIKTYIALALFLSKEGIKQRVQMGEKDVVIGPTYYKERMKEARKLVNELRKPA
jgi:ABC-type Fe3+ transport system substrate-binding protein